MVRSPHIELDGCSLAVVCAEDHCAYAMMGAPPEAIVQVDHLAGEGKGVGDSGGTGGVDNSVLGARGPVADNLSA